MHRLPLFAMSIGAFAIGTTEFIVMGVLPQIADSEQVSLSTAGLLVAAYAVGVVVGAPLLTILTTRIPRKPLLIGLMAFFALAHVGSALAPDFATLLGTRFLAGLPHGAYFGAAAVVGAALVPFEKRARAIAFIMTGLTLATVAGVPVAALVVGHVSWRFVFVAVAAIAVVCALAVALTVPDMNGRVARTKPSDEVRALKDRRIILTLATGAIGFGAMFACYTYLSSILEDVTGLKSLGVAVTLALFGLGTTLGNILGGQLADRMPFKGLYFAFGFTAAMLVVLYTSLRHPALAMGGTFLVALGASMIGPPLQRLLLDGANNAPSLASALHHSAFNLANANGAWLGGLALSFGLGAASPLLVASGLAVAGVVLSVFLARAHRDPVGLPAQKRAALAEV
ncbi:MFS transporter [Salininema proteolyticum]|uniref:MFS transporter n=1 Tax=Salininema proteolyticum TaxID=1607685 RepID=A0ABV8U475_9ACTN